MRKVLLIAALLLVVVVITAVTAGLGAAATNPHGGYSITTDACAGCHRAHTAPVGYLLLDVGYDLCVSCHNGTGSLINVVDGEIETGTHAGARLNGGGFEFVGGEAVTSIHRVEGAPDGTGGHYNGADPAYGGTSSGVGLTGSALLECASCHDPHGSTNYRMLKDSGTWNTGGLAFQTYQVGTTSDEPTDESKYSAAIDNDPWWTYYNQGMTAFCASCHKSYLARSAYNTPSTDGTTTMTYTDRVTGDKIVLPRVPYPGTQESPEDGLDIARYRHTTSRAYDGTGLDNPRNPGTIKNQYYLRMAMLQSETVSTGLREGMTCLTCHFSHGTTAAATGFAEDAGPTGGSALLYYPNRGVCNSCHWAGR